MKKLILLGFVLAGCSKGNVMETKIKEFEGFRDRMCQCTTADCAKTLYKEWQDWRAGTRELKPDDAQKAQIKDIDRAFHDCQHKVGG
jgi:hypothetical protein